MYQQNRRRHPRFRAKAVATHVRGGDKSPTAMQVDNISLGGVFVRTGDALPVGTPVILEMVRAGLKRAIELTGRVVNVITPEQAAASSRLPGMGVHFDPLSKDVEDRLAELIRAMSGPSLPIRGGTPSMRAAARQSSAASMPPTPLPTPSPTPHIHPAVRSPGPTVAAPAAQPASSRPPSISAVAPAVTVTPSASSAGAPPVLLPRMTQAVPEHAGVAAPPTAGVGAAAPQVTVQVRSLLLEIGDLKAALHEKSREVQKLQTELARMRAELQKRR